MTTEAGSLFELFYRKTAPLHAVPIAITEFSKILDKAVLLKNEKSSHEKFIQVRILDTGFLINPVSLLFHTALQTSQEPCTLRFDGDGHGCKS